MTGIEYDCNDAYSLFLAFSEELVNLFPWHCIHFHEAFRLHRIQFSLLEQLYSTTSLIYMFCSQHELERM